MEGTKPQGMPLGKRQKFVAYIGNDKAPTSPYELTQESSYDLSWLEEYIVNPRVGSPVVVVYMVFSLVMKDGMAPSATWEQKGWL